MILYMEFSLLWWEKKYKSASSAYKKRPFLFNDFLLAITGGKKFPLSSNNCDEIIWDFIVALQWLILFKKLNG